MRTVVRLGTAAAMVLSGVIMSPIAAVADCGGVPTTLEDVRLARGTTFIGTYLGAKLVPAGDGEDVFEVRWRIKEVFAGAPLPTDLTVETSICDGVVLRDSQDYLFSSASRSHPERANSIAWRVVGDALSLSGWGANSPATLYPEALQAVRTLDAALALVAPGADGLPPTDAEESDSAAPGDRLLTLVIAAVAALLWAVRTRHRRKVVDGAIIGG